MSILTAERWSTNGHLIADVSNLGYLDGAVLDCTYGLGVFWDQWKPTGLVGCDLNPEKSPIGYSVDFCKLPFEDDSFDAVVIDPPYKLTGTHRGGSRYGLESGILWHERHEMICQGIAECCRVTRRFVLVKCMDQVCAAEKRWQTLDFTNHAISLGMRLVDRFDMLITPRPQPLGRRQIHTQGNYSTLLILGKNVGARRSSTIGPDVG